MKTLKEMVTGGKLVKFEFYRKGELWYSTECGFVFPVPIDDTGDGTFLKEDKAMLFMRYIKKQMQERDMLVKDLKEEILDDALAVYKLIRLPEAQ